MISSNFSHLHIQPVGGIAGDMLLAALIDLGVNPASIEHYFAELHIDGLKLETSRVEVMGEAATYVRSLSPRSHHEHRHFSDILAIIRRAKLPPKAEKFATRVFEVLVHAESTVHGGLAHDVALHEVGALDSILDVLGISLALESLGFPTVSYSPIPSGSGFVTTAHGLLSCPVPAVKVIAETSHLQLAPIEVSGETVTPTGIAVLAATHAQLLDTTPPNAARTGIGAGTRRFETRPNVVRISGWYNKIASPSEG